MKQQLSVATTLEELKKKLEFDDSGVNESASKNCEHIKPVKYVAHSGMSDWARNANSFKRGARWQHNQLKPLLEKLIEVVKVQAEALEKINYQDDVCFYIDQVSNAREAQAKVKELLK